MAQHVRHQRQKRSRYIPALDGLRAFAVLAVIFYHMGLGWAPGGLIGVTVFFVISGYLINGLLVAEYDRSGTISLKGFWLRRARRLLPAILTSIVGIAALCTLFNHVLLDKMRPDILPSLLFYNNWWQIFGDVSYFDMAGAASPLKHFWSLSIEEQFYVVWPILLLILYRIGLKKTGIRRIALVLAILSAVEMGLLYDPHNPDPSRIYYGTDTRAMSLLIGVWLAFAAPSAAFGRYKPERESKPAGWIAFNVLGLAALAGLIAIVGLTNGYDAFSYMGGIALISVLSALLIAVLVVPRTWVARIFQLAPFVWIGKRSYGMYLWHFPILLLTTDVNSTVEMPIWMRLVQLALIFAVSALSYSFIENPIRSGIVSTWFNERRNKGMVGKEAANPVAVSLYPTRKRRIYQVRSSRIVLPTLCFVALLGVACTGIFATEKTNYAEQYAGIVNGDGAVAADTAASSRKKPEIYFSSAVNKLLGIDDGLDSTAGAIAASESAIAAVEDAKAKAETEEAKAKAQERADKSGKKTGKNKKKELTAEEIRFSELFDVAHYNDNGDLIYAPLLIGDSVSLGAEEAFYEVFPNGHLDSVVSRNIWESPYANYRKNNVVGDYVVFCLGTNNAVVDWQIDEDLLGPVEKGKKVIMVNTRSTTDWCEGTNWEIDQALKRNDKIVAVADWFGASAGHDEYFAGDGTHLTPEGAQAYVALIKDTIMDTLADDGGYQDAVDQIKKSVRSLF